MISVRLTPVPTDAIPSCHTYYWLTLTVILLLALLVRTVPLTYSHFWDETVYLQHAKILIDGRTNYNEFDYRPPLLPFLYALAFTVWNHIYAANLIQGVVTTSAVLLVFLYVKPLFGNVPALFAAFLLAFTPYFVNASHELLTDMPAVALILAAMWIFDKPGARFALLSGVASALAVQTRFTSLFVFVYFGLDTILSYRKKMRSLALLGIGAAVTIAPYLIWVKWNYGSFFHPFVIARMITDKWTVPVPSRFYYDGLLQIFPLSMFLFIGLGLVYFVLRAVSHHGTNDNQGLLTGLTEKNSKSKRLFVLLVWGLAYFAYMLSIPHKEVRYLLPLSIPVVVVSASGLTELFRWVSLRTITVKAAGLLLCIAVVMFDYTQPFQKLMQPWIDRSESESVQIAQYLHGISTPKDTIYAAHDFPVLAFYSERRTVSVLPIQVNFDKSWRDFMAQPGFFVYFDPAQITETHSRNPSFKPERTFLDSTPNFRVVRVFSEARVYRYLPAQGK
jgi:4-amino-4-deoxy-L-arabinose transferase-like glycosyltransferase